jgi:hypothetical protein
MKVDRTLARNSKYAFTWRGIKRPFDRENGIAGSELIVFDPADNAVLGVLRAFALSTLLHTKNGDRVYWLKALTCPNPNYKFHFNDGQQLEAFVQDVLKPKRPQSRYIYR